MILNANRCGCLITHGRRRILLAETAGRCRPPNTWCGNFFMMVTKYAYRYMLIPLMICVVTAGCSYKFAPGSSQPGTLTFDTPGALPMTPSPSPAMPGGTVSPPPGMQGAATPQTQSLTRPVSGPYSGTGQLLTNPGGNCDQNITITNWIVTNDRVSFGTFNGVIQADGSLSMQAGPAYVWGQFVGSHFTGRVWRPGPFCTYMLTLDPVG